MKQAMFSAAAICAGLFAGTLAGCAGTGEREAQIRTFDFGFEPAGARLGTVRAGAVRAGAPFDTQDMLYRLAYRDPAELHAFAQSRWAAPPAVLLQRRFSRASAGGLAPCVFEFEISEFSQVFASKDSSEIVIEGRAQLASASGRVGENTFLVREQDAGGSAAGGARAMARAADRLASEIAAWVAKADACRAR